MRGLRIVCAAGWYLLRRAGQRVDRLVTLACVRDAATLEAVEAQFRERAAALATWWGWQRRRLEPGMAPWYLAWRRRRPYVPDDSISWTAGAPSLKDGNAPEHDEWYGTVHNPYPAPDHDDDWLGTAAQPYANTRDVGKRRQRS